MTTIKVRYTRPMMLAGQRVEAGTELALAPLAAGDVIASGRAALADPFDRAAVDAALGAECDGLLSRLRAADQRDRVSWTLRRKRA